MFEAIPTSHFNSIFKRKYIRINVQRLHDWLCDGFLGYLVTFADCLALSCRMSNDEVSINNDLQNIRKT
jgi:hypothetical protein